MLWRGMGLCEAVKGNVWKQKVMKNESEQRREEEKKKSKKENPSKLTVQGGDEIDETEKEGKEKFKNAE